MQTNPYPPPSTIQSDPTDVMGRRVVAYLIDSVIAFVVYVIAFVTILDSLTLPSSQRATALCDVVNNSADSSVCIALGSTVYAGTGSDLGVLALLMLAFILVFHVVLPTFTGFSPGKGIMGLRVVKQDTMQTAGFGANLVRWLLWIVDAFPFFLPLVGLITGLASSNHKRVGDMAASTFVVHKNSVGQVRGSSPATTSWTPPPPTMPSAPPASADPLSDPFASPVSAAPTTSSPPFVPPTPFSPPSSTTGAPPPPPGNWAPPPPTPEPPADLTEPPADLTEPEPEPESVETADQRPGIDAPQWDEARNTYIQWDPDLEQWMEWNEGQARWVSISQ